MNGRAFVASLLLGVFCSVCAAVEPRQGTPEKTAQDFYRTYLSLRVGGLPNKRQLAALKPFLDPSITRLIQAAQRVRETAIKEHPDEKPPWDDGDLFSSLFEGARSFEVQRGKIKGERAEVPVRLRYASEGEKPVEWSDVIVLRHAEGKWLVSDILMKGKWEFKTGNSLRGILSSQ
jgi:hypothetical protein